MPEAGFADLLAVTQRCRAPPGEASDSEHAQSWGTSVSSKLLNARRTAAVQKVTLDPDGTVVFPATVDFSPDHVIVPGLKGFPPRQQHPEPWATPGTRR